MPQSKPPKSVGWGAHDPQALAHFLDSLPHKPQLLGLGEPTHGVQDFLHWRNRIFRVLVQEHGFRSIAIESDIVAGLLAESYVLGGSEPLDEVMRTGLSHSFGAYSANRELLGWMRDYNQNRAPDEQLHFYGFDPPMETMWAASPRRFLLELHAFLAQHLTELPADTATIEQLCGDEARWTNEAAAMDATQSVGRTPEANALRLIADDLQNLLKRETPRLKGQSGFWLAELNARTALGLLRYHAILADPTPSRVSQMLGQRDLMMADNLSAIRQREAKRGPTLVFAHNSHLQRPLSRWQDWTWWSAGAHLATRLGEQYAFIASTLGRGAGLPEPAPDTLEGLLSQQASTPRLYSTKTLDLPETLKRRTDTPHSYIPLKPEALAQADGLLFINTAQ